LEAGAISFRPDFFIRFTGGSELEKFVIAGDFTTLSRLLPTTARHCPQFSI
jgi:hypothetical protein